jgi:thiol-disulfide isomerase/thioredoxin
MGGADFSPEAASCFAGSLSQGDTMKSLIRAMMTGGDPSTNPELMQIMIQVMAQDCADPLEAMLVDEFVANGASAETAACIAGEFMAGGLFEAILNSMLGGTDFTTDPELNAQLQQIITGCMTPATGELVEVGTPSITGQSLPEFTTVQGDTAVGMTIPEVAGADFSGTPVSITRDGRPKIIMFFAHWCGVCQEEVPLIADWLPGATLPEGLDIISVSTGVNENSPNYPPSAWLDREGWTIPVILDDTRSSVAAAFGLSAYPYFVFVDADGKVVLRATGALPTATLEQIITQLAGA